MKKVFRVNKIILIIGLVLLSNYFLEAESVSIYVKNRSIARKSLKNNDISTLIKSGKFALYLFSEIRYTHWESFRIQRFQGSILKRISNNEYRISNVEGRNSIDFLLIEKTEHSGSILNFHHLSGRMK